MKRARGYRPAMRSPAPLGPAIGPSATLRAAGGRLLDLAFPARCAGCGAEGPPICRACRPELFARIGRPGGTLLGLPADVPAPLVQLEWCAPFEGVIRASLHNLKYAGERRLAGVLGEALAQRWRHAGGGGNVLVPVPIHRDRERQRGYDQAVLLARAAAADLGLPVAVCLERWRATTAQFELDRADRAANVARAFRSGAAWNGALRTAGACSWTMSRPPGRRWRPAGAPFSTREPSRCRH